MKNCIVVLYTIALAAFLFILGSMAIGEVSHYKIDNQKVYFISLSKDKGYSKMDLTDADPATFEAIDHQYAKDKNGIFFEGERIQNSKNSSVLVIDSE